MKSFGGNWTEQKLNAFIKYVKAYLTILNKVKTKYNWQTIYFDGFAGFGNRIKFIKDESDNPYFDFAEIDSEGISIYEGSVFRILNLEFPFIFDWYYFIDTNKNYISNLEKIKSTISYHSTDRIVIRRDDCNKQLVKLANGLKDNNKLAALIFLDPFGMQINWESIKEFKNTRSDIWILIPAGIAINRLLDRKKELKNREKLEKFFGLDISQIENIFYKSKDEETLFGTRKVTHKVSNPIEKIVEIYTMQLNTVWKYVTNQPLVLRNSSNFPIFHFLFASNNKNGSKIAKEIIAKR